MHEMKGFILTSLQLYAMKNSGAIKQLLYTNCVDTSADRQHPVLSIPYDCPLDRHLQPQTMVS